MSTHILSVVNASSSKRRSPGVTFYSPRIHDMGFVPGALVQALPAPGVVDLVLCDENIGKYSELDAYTRGRGGKLVQMRQAGVSEKQSPRLALHGQLFTDAGLSIGDRLAVQYSQGLIRLEKLPGNLRVVYMAGMKGARTGAPAPKLKLAGEWLAGFGFAPDSLLTASFGHGLASFELQDEGIESYGALVRYARQNGMKLLQVKARSSRGRLYPYVVVHGACLERTGFEIGEALLATCGHGTIKLQGLDPSGPGP